MTETLDPKRGFYLRERRQAAGLTQQKLADMVGTSKGVISELETGVARYNEDWLQKFAAVLGISPADLLVPIGGITETSANDERLRAILLAWQHMPEYQKDTLARVAESLQATKADDEQ